MKKLIIATVGCLFIYLVSCKYEPVYTQQDLDLESSIKTHSKTGNINWFIMPESSDYANFPNQDPKNPVTKPRVDKCEKYEAKWDFDKMVQDCIDNTEDIWVHPVKVEEDLF